MLVIITASNDDASKVYVKKKIERCKEADIPYHHVDIDTEGTDKEVHLRLYASLQRWANDNSCKGILLQLPLADCLKDLTQDYIDMIPWYKDVDCLTTHNQGKIMLGDNSLLPCTTQAVLDLIKSNTEQTKDECVHVVGRSTLVTKPLIVALINEGYTVRNWNSTHKDIDASVADDLNRFAKVHFVSGAGVPNLFNEDWYWMINNELFANVGICTVSERILKEDLYIYDIGMNRDENGKLCGDVERGLDVVYQTPVPGGIGPLTVDNVIKNYKKLHEITK